MILDWILDSVYFIPPRKETVQLGKFESGLDIRYDVMSALAFLGVMKTLLTLRRQLKCLEYDVCKLPYKL